MSMRRTPGSCARTLLLVVLVLLPVRLSLAAGQYALFLLHHAHDTMTENGHGGKRSVSEGGGPSAPAITSHVCCFQLTIAVRALTARTTSGPRPAWRAVAAARPASFLPDRPRKPPKPGASV